MPAPAKVDIGEKRLSTTSGQTSFDSIAAAAAGLGVDKSVLRAAKRDGAPGFRGSRVYPEELLPWLARNEESGKQKAETKDDLERQFLKVRIERQLFAFACDRREFVLAADAARWASEMVGEFVKVLDAIPSTLAPDVVGCSTVAEAETRLRAAIDEAKRQLHESPWGQKEQVGKREGEQGIISPAHSPALSPASKKTPK